MRHCFAAILAVLSLLAAREAFALGGTLERPSLSVSAASGRNAKDWLDVLSKKKYHFISGDFINWNTNLYYGGDTASLNDFLADLAAVEGTTIRVSFSKEAKTAQPAFGGDEKLRGPCQWWIQHSGFEPEVFQITIFLGDGKIDVSQLTLPAIHSPQNAAEVTKPKDDSLKPADQTPPKDDLPKANPDTKKADAKPRHF